MSQHGSHTVYTVVIDAAAVSIVRLAYNLLRTELCLTEKGDDCVLSPCLRSRFLIYFLYMKEDSLYLKTVSADQVNVWQHLRSTGM